MSDRLSTQHAHGHSHGGPPPRLTVSRPIRLVTLGLLLLVAIATAIGLAVLWPDYTRVADIAERSQGTAAPTNLEQGEVLRIAEGCDTGDRDAALNGGEPCLTLAVGVRSGPDAGRMIEVPVRGALAEAGIAVGDRVELMRNEASAGGDPSAPATDTGVANNGAADNGATDSSAADDGYRIAQGSEDYWVSGVHRGLPLIMLVLLFAAVVIAVGRLRGALALLALGVSAGVLLVFVLPALVAGGPGIPIALVGSSTIMFVTLYFVHGPNLRTTAALIGTLCGIAIMAGVSAFAVHAARLSGVGDEAAGVLAGVTSEIDFRGLLVCAIIIAGLGILNDVTITQSSAVWELRSAAPDMSRREIYARAMRIGRDHIASTVYTVFFAYVGAAMSVLILLYLYDRPMLSLLTREDLTVEIVSTLCGSVGLVLAVPITTAVATLFTPPGSAERSAHREHSAPTS